jgi:type I restriction enzyme S subunit
MSPARLLEHFDRLIDTSDAVPRLRKFILDLAVRGKLVEQNPKDEPAEELLKKIVSEKAQLVEAGKIRKQEALPAIDASEIPFELPKEWRWVRLIQVLTKLTDGTHHSPPNSETGDFKYVTAKNIKSDGVLLDGITYIDRQVHAEIFSRCDPAKGDVLYIKDGATTGIVTVNDLDEPFSMLSSVALLKLPKDIDNRLLVFFLRSPFFYDQMRGFMKGAAITRVTLKRMAPALIPLPPLAEQHRIVAKVDELMALCDELEAAQTKREKRRDRLVAATLHNLNSGDATPTPGASSTFEERVRFYFNHLPRLTTRLEHIHQLRQTILNLAVRGRLVQLRASGGRPNEGWVKSTLGEICTLITDGEHATPQRTVEGIPLATAKNVRDGHLDMNLTDWVSPATAEKCWKRCKPQHDDILIVCVGATTGRICRAQDPPDMVLVRSVALLRPRKNVVDPRYLELFLRSPAGQTQVWGGVKQAAQPCLYLGRISRFVIELPTLSEQLRIADKVEELFRLCGDFESGINTASSAVQDLLQSSLTEALTLSRT